MKTQMLQRTFNSVLLVSLLTIPLCAQDASTPAATPIEAAKPLANGNVLPTPDRSTPAGGTISGNLDVSHAVSTIEALESNNRDKLLSEISARVGATDQQVSELKNKTTNVKPEVQDSINSAWTDYQKAKSRLDSSLQAARARTGNAWDDFRAQLAADYAFYASAVAGVEVALPNS